ncbi:MAG: SCP2 domain-containing protein [Candidatus Berkiella sp.]
MDLLNRFAMHLLPLLNSVITHLDKEAYRFLAPFENKTVCFQIEHFPPMYFRIHKDGLKVIPALSDEKCDTTFSGPLNAFISMIFTKNRVQQGLHIRGDLECAKALYDTWRFLDLDFEGTLANYIGGDAARGMSEGLSKGHEWFKKTFDARSQDLGAYLQDEKKWLPTKVAMEDFFNDVDSLRLEVERLSARLDHLLANMAKGN